MRPPRCLRWFIWKYSWLKGCYWFQHVQVQNANEFDPKTKEGIPNWATYRIIEVNFGQTLRERGDFPIHGTYCWVMFFLKPTLKESLGKEWSFRSWNHVFSSSSAPLWSFDHAKATKVRIKLKLRSSRSIWLEHCFASVVFQELTVLKFSEKKTTPDPISRKFIFHEVYENFTINIYS